VFSVRQELNFIHVMQRHPNSIDFKVVQASSEPSRRPAQIGCPHCRLFGTTLLNVYINELPSAENDNIVVVSMYSDDTNAIAPSGNNLNLVHTH
jgi:hypothetical protein